MRALATSGLVLKSARFRSEREADWQRLESLLNHLEAGRTSALSDDDVIALPVLYRAALSSLSMARSISLDSNLVEYLESLCTRAYFFVYGTRTTLAEQLVGFFRHGWPQAVRALWRETLVSAVLGVLGAAVGYLLTIRNMEWYFAFMPASMAEGRTPRSTTAELAQTLFSNHQNGLAFLASFLFTHNAGIALFAFALGFACCLPTAFLLLYNGLTLGAFFALFASHGLGVPVGGWLMIHGVTELSAITLAGAAGFRIGWALSFPGRLSRLDATSAAGRTAAIVMAGVVVMLAVAGLLEGFARQLLANTPARYAVALTTALFWGFYFYGRRERP